MKVEGQAFSCKMIKKKVLLLIGLVLAGEVLAGCAAGLPGTPTLEADQQPIFTDTKPEITELAALPTSTPAMLASPPVTKIPPPPKESPGRVPAVEEVPIEPQAVEFQAQDGQSLTGRYFPPATRPAPLVVLMHWAPGDQNDWIVIADWLQNRMVPPIALRSQPWQDSSWFPPVPKERSVGVFTFTFRGCDGGCKSFTRDEWLLDAQAAMQTARQLNGIDPARIVAIGASIGADGAADGCAWLNNQYPDSCLGALSLSPGGYLTVPYAEAVKALGAEPTPKSAWCLLAQGDSESKHACQDIEGQNYQAFQYPGKDHGMMLIQSGAEPNPLEIILDFLEQTIWE